MILLQGMMAAPIVFPVLFALGFGAVYLLLLLLNAVAWLLAAHQGRPWRPVVSSRWVIGLGLVGGLLPCAWLVYRLATVELIN